MKSWETVYKETLCSQSYAYFDTGAAAPPPIPVLNAVKEYLDKTAEQGIYLPSLRKQVYQDIETIRHKLADFLGASAAEVAFTKNGTDAICQIAQGIDWDIGDEIIVPETEQLSNLSVWYLLEKHLGVKVIRAKANDQGLLEPEAIENLFTPRTRLLTFVALSNATGAIQPIRELCEMAAKHNVLSLVNASQAAGMLNHNVKELGCDFYAACGRKGLRAIEGSGFLYVKEKRIASLDPCIVGWWNSSMDNDQLSFPESAKRFEPGCPNVPAIYSLGAALDYANELEIVNIEQRVRYLTHYAIELLSIIDGFELYGPQDIKHRIGLIPFNIRGINPHDLVAMLEENGVIIEAGNFMATPILKKFNVDCMGRISISYFNSEAEIDKLIGLVKEFLK